MSVIELSLPLGEPWQTHSMFEHLAAGDKLYQKWNLLRKHCAYGLSEILYLSELATNSCSFGFLADKIKIVDLQISEHCFSSNMQYRFGERDISLFNKFKMIKYFTIDKHHKLKIWKVHFSYLEKINFIDKFSVAIQSIKVYFEES